MLSGCLASLGSKVLVLTGGLKAPYPENHEGEGAMGEATDPEAEGELLKPKGEQAKLLSASLLTLSLPWSPSCSSSETSRLLAAVDGW